MVVAFLVSCTSHTNRRSLPDHVVPFVQSWHTGLDRELEINNETGSSGPNNGPWLYVWWTDADLPWLIETYYPQYLRPFQSMPHVIMKADTARYFILHRFGGIYADMDIEYTPQNGTTLSESLQISPSSSTDDHAFIFHGCVDNSLLASTANATFFFRVQEAWHRAVIDPHNLRQVHKVSGVDMLGGVCTAEHDQPYLTVTHAAFDMHHGTNSWR